MGVAGDPILLGLVGGSGFPAKYRCLTMLRSGPWLSELEGTALDTAEEPPSDGEAYDRPADWSEAGL